MLNEFVFHLLTWTKRNILLTGSKVKLYKCTVVLAITNTTRYAGNWRREDLPLAPHQYAFSSVIRALLIALLPPYFLGQIASYG